MSFQQQISASLDDDVSAYTVQATSCYPTQLWAEFGRKTLGKASYFYDAFMRFLLDIPKGSTISSAIATLVAYASRTDDFTAQINFTNEDDAADFTTCPYTRADGGTNVAWTVPDFVANANVNTADISSLITTFIGRAGYTGNNHIAIRIKYGDATAGEFQQFYQYDGGSTKAAILTITYTAPSGQQLFTLINLEDY